MSADTLETLRTVLSARYRVERLLGSGGMATVYLAHDLKHDRPVAIKVLRPELAVALGPERFLREIQIAAKLNHPHILALHDSGEAAGLLYYVMPYVAGESLQEKLVRERQLSVEEALRITREVCAALAYAHGQGVVHRDIKPANILLSAGYALVADFGLARAISRASSQASITQPWLALGTPNYMSPEQVSGEDELDGRSDIYSLGCVLYELLAGNPPFTASNPGSTLLRQRSVPPAPIRSVRASVPTFVEDALSRALEKAAGDRFQTAEEFAAALGAGARARALPKWVTYSTFALAAAAVVALLSRILPPRSGFAAQVDTAVIAVLPPLGLAAGDAASRDLTQLLQAALRRWAGVTVVDLFQVGDALTRRGGRPLNPADAGSISRELGAGRYFRSEAVRTGDSVHLRLGFFEVGRAAALGEDSRVLRGDLVGADSVIARLVDRLLLRGLEGAETPTTEVRGTSSLPALQAYAKGLGAIQDWKLEVADSAFEAALRYDPDYPSATLWLAQVRLWNNAPAVRWRPLAEKALAIRGLLGGGEELLADGIAALARADFPAACSTYREATKLYPRKFVAWYGLATCIGQDSAVVADDRSPSRWRFRSSYQEAVNAYRHAFLLLPSMHAEFRRNGFQRIRNLLFTSGNSVKPGRALPPDTLTFYAYPGWQGDSLVFVPYLRREIARGRPEARALQQEAVLHQREVFHEIAVAWAGFYPQGADALEALALSLELLGDPSALDTLRRARLAARESKDALRVAASEIWLRLKLATPDDLRGLETVRALADSLLDRAAHPDAPDPAVLARIAVLRGRGYLAADLGARAAAGANSLVPRPLARDGPAFWTFAALGGPRDSLERLETLVVAAIESAVLPNLRASVRSDWLSRPASLAFPEVQLASLGRLPAGSESLAHAQVAATRGEWSEVRRFLEGIRVRRRAFPPEDVTLDRLYPEAHLLMLLGDVAGAAAWLDPTLAALRRLSPESLIDVPYVGGLLRGIAFRAELADRLGDSTTARRWAKALAVLWDGADPFLEPIVRRMKQLSR